MVSQERTAEKFWRHVAPMMDDRGCWEWFGDRFKRGYGRVWEGVYAHRVSFEIHYGYLPKVVMHTCDNVSCVNPAHLRGGTQLDNMRDKCAKQRQARMSLGDDVPCPQGHSDFYRYYAKRHGGLYLIRKCRVCTAEYQARYRKQRST